jgi:adenosylhomocysteine nucleosidase
MDVILISANSEWKTVHRLFPNADYQTSPFGEWFLQESQQVIFLHGGWGKIAAASSAQYAIDRWNPSLVVNLGTCGGFEGEIEVGTVILAERTLVYDIIEQMGDPETAIAHYATRLDLSWLKEPLPIPVCRELLISADRDLIIEEIPQLRAKYGARAGDWESGAIAYVAARNHVRCLILRAVTDVVGSSGDDTYHNFDLFVERSAEAMEKLIASLPGWLAQVHKKHVPGADKLSAPDSSLG